MHLNALILCVLYAFLFGRLVINSYIYIVINTIIHHLKTSKMKNEAKKLTENTQETKTAVMQVLKPETTTETKQEVKEEKQEEPQKQEQKTVSIAEVIKRVNEQYYLAEQHANFTAQLNKLHNFRSKINNNSNLTLTNGHNEGTFYSNDPQAVESLISICIDNVNLKLHQIESKLVA